MWLSAGCIPTEDLQCNVYILFSDLLCHNLHDLAGNTYHWGVLCTCPSVQEVWILNVIIWSGHALAVQRFLHAVDRLLSTTASPNLWVCPSFVACVTPVSSTVVTVLLTDTGPISNSLERVWIHSSWGKIAMTGHWSASQTHPKRGRLSEALGRPHMLGVDWTAD